MKMSTPMMKLIVYASESNLRRRLLSAMDGLADQCHMELFVDVPALNRRLCGPVKGEVWLLLVTQNLSELHCFAAMGDLIQNIRSILVLPDQERQTVFTGHALYPRFISYLDSDFSDVCSVLGTVIHNLTHIDCI
ncbi:conserved hypothetical protein [Desulfosarcina cetonica]|nr:conserved hypothetical protein [Desulfosarcina cetonica]